MSDFISYALIAERPGFWRDAIEEALRPELPNLEVTDSGQILLEQLERTISDRRLVIVGSDLTEPSGLDVLFNVRERPGIRQSVVLLVTDVRLDHEMLNLYRARGVLGFLYRSDPLEKTIQIVENLIWMARRASPRFSVDLPMTVSLLGVEVKGRFEDLSLGGAQFTVRAEVVADEPQPGDPIEITTAWGQVLHGEVRRCLHVKNVLGDRYLVGVRFRFTDPAQQQLLVHKLEELKRSAG